MKIFFCSILSLLLSINNILSQNTHHRVYISIGDLNHFDKDVSDFYFFNGFNPGDDTKTFDQEIFQFKLNYELQLKNNLFFGTRVGYGFRNENYIVGNQGDRDPIGTEKIDMYNLSFFLGKSWSLKKLEFGVGLEIPFYMVSQFKETYKLNSPDRVYNFRRLLEGGDIFGVCLLSRIKWQIWKELFISTDVSIGYLKYDLGGIWKWETLEDYPNGNLYEDEFQREYKLAKISKPSFQFGIGINL